jgi:hypothetical protein
MELKSKAWPRGLRPPRFSFASLGMTLGFGLCFKLGLRNISRCKNCAG